jgi:hypothetical protein
MSKGFNHYRQMPLPGPGQENESFLDLKLNIETVFGGAGIPNARGIISTFNPRVVNRLIGLQGMHGFETGNVNTIGLNQNLMG